MFALSGNRSEVEGGAAARHCEGSNQHYGRSPVNYGRKRRAHDPVDAPVFTNRECGNSGALAEFCRKSVILFERTANW